MQRYGTGYQTSATGTVPQAASHSGSAQSNPRQPATASQTGCLNLKSASADSVRFGFEPTRTTGYTKICLSPPRFN